MKRIYQLLLSFLFLTSGVVAAMDNQGQDLMDAIQNGDLVKVQNILVTNTVDLYAKIDVATPLELASQRANFMDPNNDIEKSAHDIKKAIVDQMLSNQGLFKKFRDSTPQDMINFINYMQGYALPDAVMERLLLFCASLKTKSAHIDALIHYTQLTNGTKIVFPILWLGDCPSLIPDLINNYPQGKNSGLLAVAESTLPEWITWCIDHGAPIDGTDSEGSTPLLLAVRGDGRSTADGYIDIVKILLERGASPKQESRGETPISLIEKKCSAKGCTPVNDEIKCRLKGEFVAGSTGSNAKSKSFATNFSKIFVSYKTWVAIAVCYLGVKCYKQVTSGYTAKYGKNVIVNEAGTDISVTDENKNITTVHTGEDNVLELSKFEGSLTVKFQDTSKNTSKDLVIDLDRYADDDYHMNIIIRPTKWFERLFVRSPLYYSVTWKRKAAPQKSTHEAVHETV